MKQIRILIFVLAILIMSFIASAQDHIFITPPANYPDPCRSEQREFMLSHFGPHCINPVYFNLDGFREIGTAVTFTRADGTSDDGVIVGYTWQFPDHRYFYYVMTQMPNVEARFGGAFEHVAPERLTN